MKRGVLVLLVFLGLAAIADARPGGGHSSSGGGRSSSSSRSSSGGYRSSGGGGGGGGSWEIALIAIGIMVVISIIKTKTEDKDWSSGAISYTPPPPQPSANLATLAQRDPDFSLPAIEDFVFQLFAAAHRARSSPAELNKLQPYLDPRVISLLAGMGAAPSQVVIGTLRLIAYKQASTPPADLLVFHVEATLFTHKPSYVIEEWTLTRAPNVKSKPPVSARTWPCPNCGAPWQGDIVRKCQHCGEVMETGRFDWSVSWIARRSEKSVLASLTGTVAEYGNHLPTVYRTDAMELMQAITADDPHVTFEAVRARVALIYARMNQGWNERNLIYIRGLATSALQDYLDYWLKEYQRQGLHNRLDNARIEYIELAKVTRDRHFDAITMRVRAVGNDYTLDAKGKVVGGSKTDDRHYTEYWTVLRSSSRRGPVNNTPSCPNCGAGLQINDTGACTHCNAMIESGNFDWILSKIEQDDNYVG